ncbi:hypothetical protein [Alicyclobacillus shizuokensis]|uniref:hypothetical protein n=1 Tax=Alicyclobacillus shizuokensis TaxID=392014 RepID=UPI0012EE0BF7|nr:hypothetical protein [Alicyclobacillus shizuokensis]
MNGVGWMKRLKLFFHELMVRFYSWRLEDDNDMFTHYELLRKHDHHLLQALKISKELEAK